MTDLFGEWVSDDWLQIIFEAMAAAPEVTFQILTKRPERAYKFITSHAGKGWPLPNVWLGVTVENQRWADERIPILHERLESASHLLRRIGRKGKARIQLGVAVHEPGPEIHQTRHVSTLSLSDILASPQIGCRPPE